MLVRSDVRRLLVFRLKTHDGEVLSDQSTDIWQDEDGHLDTTGIWEGLVPISPSDVEMQAKGQGITPLEWMYRRLRCCSMVRVEVIN